MATVFMRWLERRPGDYDRGMELLTLGRLGRVKERIAAEYIQVEGRSDPRVLEIGCGTGTLSLLMAEQGAHVTAIDASPDMLAVAKRKAEIAGLADIIQFHRLDATELVDRFDPSSFDVVVGTLILGELPPEVRRYVLQEALQLLKPEGRLVIADETVPEGMRARLVYWAVRLPLVALTWLLTRTSTATLRDFPDALVEAGFILAVRESQLGGSLQLITARPATLAGEGKAPVRSYPQLRHQVTPKTLLLDLWSCINRMVPPYPKAATGLYRVGHPDRTSPVMVTGNYELTVRRLVRALDGRVDCWLVVANSRGINVWCAAGGGHFTADDVIAALKTSGVIEVVDRHALILPQLCANGVDGWKIRRETGWGVDWGPVRAEDIAAYLEAGGRKDQDMRRVRFPLKDRLEMTTLTLGFYGALLAVLALIFWRPHLWTILGAMLLLSYVYGVSLPWLPGRDGLTKGLTLAAITLLGLWSWSYSLGHLAAASLLNWSLGLGFLAFFVGAEFQGMSPLMRGEQGNWIIEGRVGLVVLALYGVGRLLLGG
jgi:2-polyprenyl-3-methyl-5-hydroxy-6-metoxy-1,4-benzoquinol methylase